MWSDLPSPWQACLELAWQAYCDDCIPIGAVVTDSGGRILASGRNRIFEKTKPGGVNGTALAHAEVEALRGLDLDAVDPHTCLLYTTTEPCPMCMGAFYMSGLRTLHYAARDPYAGSTNMLGTTWYLRRKPIMVFGPDPRLETIVVALFAEQDAHFHNEKFLVEPFWKMYREAIPGGVELGLDLARRGALQVFRNRGAVAQEVMEFLLSQVK
ncbi:MAG: nucleoside deaminase [Chloroflexi bacterium]|nr:nucleoside deaminase [Chloroflexota bacterium]